MTVCDRYKEFNGRCLYCGHLWKDHLMVIGIRFIMTKKIKFNYNLN